MIYIFKRPDNVLWADFMPQGRVVKKIKADTVSEINSVLRDPGPLIPARVRALAERASREIWDQKADVTPEVVRRLSFFRRLKWLVTGA